MGDKVPAVGELAGWQGLSAQGQGLCLRQVSPLRLGLCNRESAMEVEVNSKPSLEGHKSSPGTEWG